jgi:hypothetical protein
MWALPKNKKELRELKLEFKKHSQNFELLEKKTVHCRRSGERKRKEIGGCERLFK